MAPRFSRPRLIDDQDRQYRAHLERIMLARSNFRAMRPPRARDLFGGEAEAALRGWLEQRYTLSNRRIVEYHEHRGRSAIKKYRELDAVVLEDARTIRVFEIKASQKATSLRRAVQQLRDTTAILHMLFPRVYTTILLVDTGIPTAADVAALMAAPDAPPEPPPTLDEMLATLPQVRLVGSLDEQADDPAIVRLLRFNVDDIVALAGAENLHLDWDEDDEELDEVDQEQPEEEEPRFTYTSGEEEGDEKEGGALGEALRRALQGRAGDER